MGAKVGLNKTQIRDMESGKVKISESRANLLQDRFGLNKDWLMAGQGEMKAPLAALSQPDIAFLADMIKMQAERMNELQRSVNTLRESFEHLGLEIGRIRDKMEDAAQTGDIHRLGIIGGKGK